jgi:hypothetical protein
MPKILLAGGFEESPKADSSLRAFARALAAEIVAQGHTLLGGCQTTLDAEAAAAAQEALKLQGNRPRSSSSRTLVAILRRPTTSAAFASRSYRAGTSWAPSSCSRSQWNRRMP